LLEVLKADVEEILASKTLHQICYFPHHKRVKVIALYKNAVHGCKPSLYVTSCEWNAYVDITASLYCVVFGMSAVFSV
jgi:hypothetical protein